MLDDLVSVIETLQQRIRDHSATLRENETRTRMALIDPLLTALGWDVSDPMLVTPEYSIGDDFVDYALLGLGNRPIALVEAKKLGLPLVAQQRQLFGYCEKARVGYGVLTDGGNWRLYDVGKPDNDRLIDTIPINDVPAYRCALRLLLLWRPNLASGQPAAAGNPIFQTTPSVTQTLTQLEQPVQAPMPVATSAPNSLLPTDPGWEPLANFIEVTYDDPPSAIRFPDGTEREVQYWYHLIEHSVAWLWATKRLTQNVSSVPSGKRGNSRRIIATQPVHPSGTKFHAAKPVLGTPFVFERAFGSNDMVKNMKTLLQHCGIDPATVQLQVGQ